MVRGVVRGGRGGVVRGVVRWGRLQLHCHSTSHSPYCADYTHEIHHHHRSVSHATSCPLWNHVTLGGGWPAIVQLRVTMEALITSSDGITPSDRNSGASGNMNNS